MVGAISDSGCRLCGDAEADTRHILLECEATSGDRELAGMAEKELRALPLAAWKHGLPPTGWSWWEEARVLFEEGWEDLVETDFEPKR